MEENEITKISELEKSENSKFDSSTIVGIEYDTGFCRGQITALKWFIENYLREKK